MTSIEYMNAAGKKIAAYADGERSSVEIASLVGLSPRYVRRLMEQYDMPRLAEGARLGQKNHQYIAGRRITLNGYVKITPPVGYVCENVDNGKTAGWMFEHRYVLEQKLGRFLLPEERVDHVDGLTLHNHPNNLRAFPSNTEHLQETLSGKAPRWSEAGYQNMFLRHSQPEALQRVNIHQLRLKSGAVRLRQILLAALQLGINSPYLLGTHQHTKKAGIDMSSHSTIERALADLCAQWGWGHIP
jgi:hypothetical protein